MFPKEMDKLLSKKNPLHASIISIFSQFYDAWRILNLDRDHNWKDTSDEEDEVVASPVTVASLAEAGWGDDDDDDEDWDDEDEDDDTEW